jgi:multiple antibiotic resistance protein
MVIKSSNPAKLPDGSPSPASEKKNKLSDGAITWLSTIALIIIFTLIYLLIILPAMNAGGSEDLSQPVNTRSFPMGKVFTLLFLMLGPFKIIGPFANIAQGTTESQARKVAVYATIFASIALLFAAFLGRAILIRFGIPLPMLALSAGIIFTLVALVSILQQFKPAILPEINVAIPVIRKATSFAFPTIVTPYGIAALVVFIALSPDQQQRIAIGAIVFDILLLNLIFMLITRYIFRFLGIFLQILGAVLSVIQVALGLQIINNSLREILK